MKIQKVQNFDQFTSQKIEEANDSFFSFDFLGNLFNKGFDAFTDVLKGKVTAYLMEYLGIGEGTILSKLVQNFVEQIEVKDYYAILFKSKMNARYLAPKAANATMEFLVEKGFGEVAKALGVSVVVISAFAVFKSEGSGRDIQIGALQCRGVGLTGQVKRGNGGYQHAHHAK